MFFADLLFVLLIATLFASLVGRGYQRREWDASLVIFFMIIFITTWAGGLWIRPIGKPLFGVYWISYLTVGLFISILLTVVYSTDTTYKQKARRNVKGNKGNLTKEEMDEIEALEAVGCLFWFLIAFMIIPIVLHYL